MTAIPEKKLREAKRKENSGIQQTYQNIQSKHVWEETKETR